MPTFNFIGALSGIVSILALAVCIGKYLARVERVVKMTDTLQEVTLKVDTLWKVYIEDALMKRPNPAPLHLPEDLHRRCVNLLRFNELIMKQEMPTPLLVNMLGISRLASTAADLDTTLNQVIAEIHVLAMDQRSK